MMNRDIENNIGETEIPNFTIEHVNSLDKKYNLYFSKSYDAQFVDKCDDMDILKLSNIFELNELYIEHVDTMKQLLHKMREYNSIGEGESITAYMNIRMNKIRMYFEDIVPLVESDEKNLKLVIEIISSV